MTKMMVQILAISLLMLLIPLTAGATNKTFSSGSIIIPMDPCWQPNSDPDVDPAFLHSACDYQTAALRNDQGVFQAYGLVYTLLRLNVPVHWIIDADKTTRNGIDFTVAGDATTPPIVKYTSDPAATTTIDPTTLRTVSDATLPAHVVEYRGGPFVIKQQDLSVAAQAVLNRYVNVKKHVAQVSFTAPVEKVLANLPPKIAVLGQGATDVMKDYLTASGLGNQTNVVYNIIQPTQIMDGTLASEYQLFWAPHWIVEDEIAAQADRDAVMLKLREFLEAGNSAFLECASIESIEGSSSGGVDASTQTSGGWLTDKTDTKPRIETNLGSQQVAYMTFEDPVSYLTQCAGWKYQATGGHVHNLRPKQTAPYSYNPTVTRFIHDTDGAWDPSGTSYDPGFDYYVGGRINGSSTQGYVSYLAGHKYAKCNGAGGGDFIVKVELDSGISGGEYVDLTLTYDVYQTVKARYFPDGTFTALGTATKVDQVGEKQVHDGVMGFSFLESRFSPDRKKIENLQIVNRSAADHNVVSFTVEYPSSGGQLKKISDENSVTGIAGDKFCENVGDNPATCPVGYDLPGVSAADATEVTSCDVTWSDTNTCGLRYVLNTVLGLQFTLVSAEYVASSPIIDGKLLFTASFEYPAHIGHLKALDLSATVDADRLVWDSERQIPLPGTGANPGSTTSSDPPDNPAKNNAYRYIFTNNVAAEVPFTVAQAANLQTRLGSASLNSAKGLINTVRGRFGASDTLIDGTSDQGHRLWGITRSTSAVIPGSPIIHGQKTRDRIAYIGAEDGMLHAFYAGSWDATLNGGQGGYAPGSGREIWAYIPSSLLPSLKNQPFNDSNRSAVVNVDGSPAVEDFFIDLNGDRANEWHTILVGTASVQSLNKGIVFAIDITDPYAPDVLWERTFADLNMGDSRGVAVGSLHVGGSLRNSVYLTSTYHAKLASDGTVDPVGGSYGINAYSLDLATGDLHWQFKSNYDGTAKNINESPAIPALMDLDNTGNEDYLVFGDMAGRLWALDTKTGDPITANDDPVYTVPAGAAEPIGAGVAIYNNDVVFGTGGADFATGSSFALYSLTLARTGGTFRWKYALNTGEKVWSAPTFDGYGQIFVGTGVGFNSQSSADAMEDTTGRLLILDKAGTLKKSIATAGAELGSVDVGSGTAIAVSYTGKVTQFGTPDATEASGSVQSPSAAWLKIFSWRLR